MIQFKNVSKGYGDYLALDNINAQVKQGEVIVVCGPSGSGKSTLIRTVNRLEPIQQGEIYVEDTPVHTCSSIDELRSHLGFVFQQFNLFPHMNEIGRAHVWTPVTNAHLVCRLMLEKKNIYTHFI